VRILQISHNYHIVGGSDAVFFATCDLLNSAGHEVIPFCMDHPKNRATPWQKYFPRGADSQTAPIRDGLRYFYNSEARTKLEQLLQHAGPIDVAHLHIYHGKQTPAILPLLRTHGIPVVHTLHEYKLACPVYTMQRHGQPCDLCVQGSDLNCIRHACKDRSVLRSLVMAAEKTTARLFGDVRLVDRFLCVSGFQRQIMARAGLPAERLFTLHNFVPTDDDAPQEGHDGYFLYAGRIEELKGIATLVDAFKRSGQGLKIVGDGDWRSELEKSVSDTRNITYLGFQHGEKLQRLMRRAQAIVVPSQWYENCPMTVLEAKAYGRPVIAANIGGIPELIHHGVDGMLFEPGDVDGLIAATEALVNADHQTFAVNARKDARARFSSKMHLNSLLAHYAAVINASPQLALQPA